MPRLVLVPGYSAVHHLSDELIAVAQRQMEGRPQTRRSAQAVPPGLAYLRAGGSAPAVAIMTTEEAHAEVMRRWGPEGYLIDNRTQSAIRREVYRYVGDGLRGPNDLGAVEKGSVVTYDGRVPTWEEVFSAVRRAE